MTTIDSNEFFWTIDRKQTYQYTICENKYINERLI